MATTQLNSRNPFDYIRSVLRKINSRQPDKVARLIDAQFNTADRISSAYSRLREAQKANRELTGFESALSQDAARCLQGLDLKQLRLPFWWKYGTWLVTGVIAAAVGLGFAGYQWHDSYKPPLASTGSHLSTEVQSLRGLSQQLGEVATGAREPNFKVMGDELISASDYLDLLARSLGSQELMHIGATIKTAGADLKVGKLGEAGKSLSEAGKDMAGIDSGGISFAEARQCLR